MVTEEVTTDHQRVDVGPNQPLAGILEPVGDAPTADTTLSDKSRILHYCRTESDSPAAINFGFDDIIHLWKEPSMLTYNFDKDFPQYEREFAAGIFAKAVEEWGKAGIEVRFERVPDDGPAVFQFVYRPSNGGNRKLARAFFPGDRKEARQLRVYELAFSNGCRPRMFNIFCHELGHILGLRHEFAPEQEENQRCATWGERNTLSVMCYFKDLSRLCVQASDIKELKQFYDYPGEMYHSFRIVRVDPDCLDV
ncbi:hypothetical protein F5Y13DRAFT_57447 [Hypoxylon sp. FL1857]|nr:hypothetical protein F5Y13DRAFT_57447 [Hypoxylon sp. FL1857]